MSYFLFDNHLLQSELSCLDLSSNFLCRPLEYEDFSKGFMNLLSQLTRVGDVNESQFKRRFELMVSCPHTYFIVVIQDLNSGSIVASASLVLEYKFIRDTAIRGRIEDVVVDSDFRKEGLGKFLVELLTSMGRKFCCYKMTLECNDKLLDFYEKSGYTREDGNNHVVLRLAPK